MPELPEVEIVKQSLNKKIKLKKIIFNMPTFFVAFVKDDQLFY